MSHDQRRQAPLERPSLFAPVDDDEVENDPDMQQVHILSTLESARRPPRMAPSKTPRQRSPIVGEGSPWQIKLLMVLMGTGIVTLMAAFVMLVLDNSEMRQAQAAAPASATAAHASQRARPIPADRHNPLAALMTQPSASMPPLQPDQQAAIIENLPVDPTAPVTTPVSAQAQAQAAAAGLQADAARPGSAQTASAAAGATPGAGIDKAQANTLAGMPTVAKSSLAPAPAPRPLLALTTPPTDHAMSRGNPPAASGTSQAVQTAQTTRPRPKTKDDDVALLEAVLAHSATRKPQAAVSASEALQRCGKSGDGTAIACRARVCVQAPGTPGCQAAP